MQKIIITMCGTSALFEHSDWNPSNKFDDPVDLVNVLETERENGKKDEYNHQKGQTIDNLKTSLKHYFLDNNVGLSILSAEIASLLAMEKDKSIGPITEKDKIFLLYSDTEEGRLCAEANKEVIEQSKELKGWAVEIIKVEGLQLKYVRSFVEEGIQKIEMLVTKIRQENEGYKFYINITGGYKGVIPALCKIAIKGNMPLFYLFESCKGLVWMNIGAEEKIIFSSTDIKETEKTNPEEHLNQDL